MGSMTDIGTLGGVRSGAYGINSAGEIVGDAWTTQGNRRAFLYTNGVMMNLGTLGGAENASYSYATGINDRRQVVGTSWTDGSDPHAFLFEEGRIVDLISLVVPDSRWTSLIEVTINNDSQIAGVGIIDGLYHAFLMSPVAIPEPSTFALLTLGLAGFGARRWRKTRLT
jgi:probable HAF family extracellular repeat protein